MQSKKRIERIERDIEEKKKRKGKKKENNKMIHEEKIK